MGLDITAYSKLEKLDVAVDADGEPIGLEWDKYHRCHINDDFPGRSGALVDGAIYGFSNSMRFRAGSYSGYNSWRSRLAALAGYTPHSALEGRVTSGPFFELVNFSDCEGDIGPEVSEKLARDFAENQVNAEATRDEWFIECYANWRKAFEMAANGGAVSFH